LSKSQNIQIRRDPNHFSKKVKKSGEDLELQYEEFWGLGLRLKNHFLITIAFKLPEEEWKVVWYSFIPHNIYNEHSTCRHPELPEDYEPHFFGVSSDAVEALQDLLMGLLPAPPYSCTKLTRIRMKLLIMQDIQGLTKDFTGQYQVQILSLVHFFSLSSHISKLTKICLQEDQ